jgi:hypothetical protein
MPRRLQISGIFRHPKQQWNIRANRTVLCRDNLLSAFVPLWLADAATYICEWRLAHAAAEDVDKKGVPQIIERSQTVMACNLGVLERLIRAEIGVGVVLFALFYVSGVFMAVLLYILAAFALITGIAGYCPAWAVFGFSTCGAERAAAGRAPKVREALRHA